MGNSGISPQARRHLGRGAYEGIHPDNHGNLILAEDIGGTKVSIDPTNPNGPTKTAANPNSFVYRFVPNNARHLLAGPMGDHSRHRDRRHSQLRRQRSGQSQ
jgi:hypothetical protein